MAAVVLGLQDAHCLVGRDPAGALGVVLDDKAGKGLTNDEAHIQRQARVVARHATGAVQDNNVVRVLKHNVTGQGVGNGLVQVGQSDVLIDGDQLGGLG